MTNRLPTKIDSCILLETNNVMFDYGKRFLTAARPENLCVLATYAWIRPLGVHLFRIDDHIVDVDDQDGCVKIVSLQSDKTALRCWNSISGMAEGAPMEIVQFTFAERGKAHVGGVLSFFSFDEEDEELTCSPSVLDGIDILRFDAYHMQLSAGMDESKLADVARFDNVRHLWTTPDGKVFTDWSFELPGEQTHSFIPVH